MVPGTNPLPFPSRTYSCSPQIPGAEAHSVTDPGRAQRFSLARHLQPCSLGSSGGPCGRPREGAWSGDSGPNSLSWVEQARSRANTGPQEAGLPSAGSSSRLCLGRSSGMSSPFPAARGTGPEEGAGGGLASSCQLALPQQKAAPGSWPTLP